MALEQLYQDVLLEHNRRPCNHSRLSGATHAARGQDASCGDDLLIELVIAGGRIQQAAFSGLACAVTTASASMMTEWLTGRLAAEVQTGLERFQALLEDPGAASDPALGPINQLQPVGAFPARRRNALLPWRTAVKALTAPVDRAE